MLSELFSRISACISTGHSGEKKSHLLNTYNVSVPALGTFGTLSPWSHKDSVRSRLFYLVQTRKWVWGWGHPASRRQSQDLNTGSAWHQSLPFCEQANWGGNITFLPIPRSETIPSIHFINIFSVVTSTKATSPLGGSPPGVSQQWVCWYWEASSPGAPQLPTFPPPCLSPPLRSAWPCTCWCPDSLFIFCLVYFLVILLESFPQWYSDARGR